MAPNTTLSTPEVPTITSDNSTLTNNKIPFKTKEQKEYKSIIGTYGTELKWVNIISITLLHALAVWGLIVFPYFQNLKLVAYGFLLIGLSGFGITAGAHRLWSHRSYKATLPLRTLLMFCFCIAGQNSLYDWIRDHRIHHRYTETDADPHNSARGFFFAHVGWLMMKKHPEVIRRGKEVDMSDVASDPVVQFHEQNFLTLKLLFGFIIPSIIPPLCWGQDWYWSILLVCVIRYIIGVNITWSVNSAAHMFGNKPYDKGISPSDNFTVAVLAMGEGWHNYHHTFPWDYKTAELGKYSVNFTTFYLDLFSKIGWAYDLKTPSKELIKRVILKTGDGSHAICEHREIPESAETELLCSSENKNTKSD